MPPDFDNRPGRRIVKPTTQLARTKRNRIVAAAISAALVALALNASAALAHIHPPYNPPRYLLRAARRHVHAQRSEATQPGFGVVLSSSSSELQVSGLPLDEFGVPFVVNSGHGLKLSVASANLYVTRQLCAQRARSCSTQGFPSTQQWFPVSAASLLPHDVVLVTFGVSAQTAASLYRQGTTVPAAYVFAVS
jgi:hypothetical protein